MLQVLRVTFLLPRKKETKQNTGHLIFTMTEEKPQRPRQAKYARLNLPIKGHAKLNKKRKNKTKNKTKQQKILNGDIIET